MLMNLRYYWLVVVMKRLGNCSDQRADNRPILKRLVHSNPLSLRPVHVASSCTLFFQYYDSAKSKLSIYLRGSVTPFHFSENVLL